MDGDLWGGAKTGLQGLFPTPSHRSRSSSSRSRMVARLSSPKLSLEGPEPWLGLPSGVRAVGSGPRAGGWNLRLYKLVMSIWRAGGRESGGQRPGLSSSPQPPGKRPLTFQLLQHLRLPRGHQHAGLLLQLALQVLQDLLRAGKDTEPWPLPPPRVTPLGRLPALRWGPGSPVPC